MKCFAFLTCVGMLAVAAVGPSGEYNKVINIGDSAPQWSGLPGTDGKKHALADWKDKSVVVVLFTCNTCPVAVVYEDRIIAFAKKHAGPASPVGLVAINVNRLEEDRLPAMTERAKEKGIPFPYLFDESQKIARDFGAAYMPEFFVLDKARKVAYMGSMDDKSPPGEPKTHYLDDAVSAILKGEKPAKTETLAAAGCRIKFARAK